MTSIIGLEQTLADGTGYVYMAVDSRCSSDNYYFETDVPKLFSPKSSPEFLIGVCQSVRATQLLQCQLSLRKQNSSESDYEYLVTEFIESVRTTFKDFGFSRVESNEEVGGTFLVAYRKKLYCVYSDFQINRAKSGFTAIGSGSNYSLGSLIADLNKPDDVILKYNLLDHIDHYFEDKHKANACRVANSIITASMLDPHVDSAYTVKIQ